MLQDECPLCDRSYEGLVPCLDHCHVTGLIRAPLCRNCNSQLGKIENAAIRCKGKNGILQFLEAAVAYVKYHQENPSLLEHPTHNKPKKRKPKNGKRKSS